MTVKYGITLGTSVSPKTINKFDEQCAFLKTNRSDLLRGLVMEFLRKQKQAELKRKEKDSV